MPPFVVIRYPSGSATIATVTTTASTRSARLHLFQSARKSRIETNLCGDLAPPGRHPKQASPKARLTGQRRLVFLQAAGHPLNLW